MATYLFLCGDVVINKGNPLIGTLPPYTRDPCHRHLAGLDGGLCPITAELGFLLLQISKKVHRSILWIPQPHIGSFLPEKTPGIFHPPLFFPKERLPHWGWQTLHPVPPGLQTVASHSASVEWKWRDICAVCGQGRLQLAAHWLQLDS